MIHVDFTLKGRPSPGAALGLQQGLRAEGAGLARGHTCLLVHDLPSFYWKMLASAPSETEQAAHTKRSPRQLIPIANGMYSVLYILN